MPVSQIMKSRSTEEEKEREEDRLFNTATMNAQNEMSSLFEEIFRPRTTDETDTDSERRILLSTPLVIVNSNDECSITIDLFCNGISNCENCISRFDCINAISMDLSKSSFTYPLLEEYRVPTSDSRNKLGGKGQHAISSPKLRAFTKSKFSSAMR